MCHVCSHPCSLQCHKEFWNLPSCKCILPPSFWLPHFWISKATVASTNQELLWGPGSCCEVVLEIPRPGWEEPGSEWSVYYHKSHLLGTCHTDLPWFQSGFLSYIIKEQIHYLWWAVSLRVYIYFHACYFLASQLSTSTQHGAVSPEFLNVTILHALKSQDLRPYALSAQLGLSSTLHLIRSQLSFVYIFPLPRPPSHPIVFIKHLPSTRWGQTLGKHFRVCKEA